jgi:hypothetical protein
MKYAPLTPAEHSLSERDLLDGLAASPAYGLRARSDTDPHPLGAMDAIDRPLSKLEEDVLKLAGRDRLSTIRQPGRLQGWIQWMLGVPRANPLADPRLEALRRYYVAKRFGRVDLVGQATLRNLLGGSSFEGVRRRVPNRPSLSSS